MRAAGWCGGCRSAPSARSTRGCTCCLPTWSLACFRRRWRAYLEEKPVLASSAYVKQGRNCSIHPSTVFHGPVTIGDNVTIGPGCVIAQSTIGNDVTLNGANYFHLSVVGDRCFFPVGA